MVTREFTWELKWNAGDADMAEEDTKVHISLVLSQDTLSRVDA